MKTFPMKIKIKETAFTTSDGGHQMRYKVYWWNEYYDYNRNQKRTVKKVRHLYFWTRESVEISYETEHVAGWSHLSDHISLERAEKAAWSFYTVKCINANPKEIEINYPEEYEENKYSDQDDSI